MGVGLKALRLLKLHTKSERHPLKVSKFIGTLKTLTLTLTLNQGQLDGWIGVCVKSLLPVKLHTKYESHPFKVSKVIWT